MRLHSEPDYHGRTLKQMNKRRKLISFVIICNTKLFVKRLLLKFERIKGTLSKK